MIVALASRDLASSESKQCLYFFSAKVPLQILAQRTSVSLDNIVRYFGSRVYVLEVVLLTMPAPVDTSAIAEIFSDLSWATGSSWLVEEVAIV